MGKWRAIIAVAFATGIALMSGVLIYRWMQGEVASQKPVEPVREPVSVAVAVAAVDLPWGTKLSREMIEMVPFFKRSLPKGYFADASPLEGRVIITPLGENEPIIESKLAPSSVTAGGVSAIVSPGKRALAVKGDKVIGLSGFIRPRDRVDVLVTLTEKRKGSRNERQITKIVLEDILVLATGAEMKNNEKDGKGNETSPVDVYTLEVTPEEGEKLALASTQGRLQLALRNVTDRETVLTTGATIPEVLASFRPSAKERWKSRANARKQKNLSFTVYMIRGDEVSKVKMNTDGTH